MRFPIFLLVLMLTGFSICRGDQIDDLYRKYDDTVCNADFPKKADLSWVTPELRQAFIQKAHTLLGKPPVDPNKDPLSAPDWEVISADRVLIELGDKSYLDSYWQQYHEEKTGVTPSIQMLPHLADDLYHGDTRYYQAGDVLRGSIMDESTGTMYQILRTYPCFPTATRDWANSGLEWKGGGPNSKSNQLMREWWQHNKEAVLDQKYNEATWLPFDVRVQNFRKTVNGIVAYALDPLPGQNGWFVAAPVAVASFALAGLLFYHRRMSRKILSLRSAEA